MTGSPMQTCISVTYCSEASNYNSAMIRVRAYHAQLGEPVHVTLNRVSTQQLCQTTEANQVGAEMQAEHYDRSRQQQVDIGLLAPEEAKSQEPAEQVRCCR